MATFDLTVDRETGKDVLRALLHGIFFHRLFGVVKPTNIDCLGVMVPAVRDTGIEQLVDGNVGKFMRALQGVRQPNKEGRIEVSFVEIKKKPAGWFSNGGEEEVPWETWFINVKLEQPQHAADREALQEALSVTLSKAVMTMLEYSASEASRAAVPLIQSAQGISPFPIRTVLVVAGQVVP